DNMTDMIQYGNNWIDLKNVWFYKMYEANNGGRTDKLLFYGSDKGIYFSRIITEMPMIIQYFSATFDEMPTFNYNIKLNGKDYTLFGSENLGVFKFAGLGNPVEMPDFPNLNSMCEDKGKLFGSGYGERNVLFYHTDNDFTTWSTTVSEVEVTSGLESDTQTTETDLDTTEKEYKLLNGKIEMNDNRGKINKVIPFLGYVFAIRDYGISKIINYENKTNLDVVHLSLSGSRIFEKTVCICGDKMLMLTKDGLCSFNGVTSKVLNLSFNAMLSGENNDCATAVFHSGKYYLACKLNFEDDNEIGCETVEGYKNNALIILNPETNEFEILRGVDIACMCSIQLNSMDKIAIILNNLETQRVIELDKSGKFFSTPLVKEWVSPLSDLGYSNKLKFVREFTILSKYDAEITIFTENASKTFKLLGSETLNKIRVNLKGKQIGIKIRSITDKAYIGNLKLGIDLIDYGFNG
ncbi:MAG: hypothetical protein ACI4TI_03970, partial [Christensenellales bacterium]